MTGSTTHVLPREGALAEDPAADDLAQLLARIQAGDRSALDELLTTYRESVRQFLDRRLDPRLRSRVDVSDVIQETQLEIAHRINDFLARSPMPFRVWMLQTAHQQLLRIRRHHTAVMRDVDAAQQLPDSTSVLLVARLAAQTETPSQVLSREEQVRRVRVALAELPETDREVILLRTFEGLSNLDTALVLELDPDTTSKRFTRALLKLRSALGEG